MQNLDVNPKLWHAWAMPKRSSNKPPTDLNELAASILEAATGSAPSKKSTALPAKNPAAVALGRLGGLKGGNARAAKLSKTKMSEIAKKAAEARWSKKG
jgi:hypothetical protein